MNIIGEEERVREGVTNDLQSQHTTRVVGKAGEREIGWCSRKKMTNKHRIYLEGMINAEVEWCARESFSFWRGRWGEMPRAAVQRVESVGQKVRDASSKSLES